jgi:hypothetical protein
MVYLLPPGQVEDLEWGYALRTKGRLILTENPQVFYEIHQEAFLIGRSEKCGMVLRPKDKAFGTGIESCWEGQKFSFR